MDKDLFVIAEMSGNHNQSLERALKIVDAAAASGADAVKIQTYKPETMTIDSEMPDFLIDNKKSLWYGKRLFDLYKEAMLPWEWHEAIFKRCKEKGIIGFSTPYDATSVDFLESIGSMIYKIASFELIDLPLIKRVAATGKPIIMSTGMATLEEIKEAVDMARANGCADITLLKCTSTYPADPKNSNILTIPDMAGRFGCKTGLSDHTMGIGVSLASIALGAKVIEKHFTLSRKEGGLDSAFSMEPDELKELVEESRKVLLSLGRSDAYGPTKDEIDSLKYRRSVYAVKDIKKGEKISALNIGVIRPGLGLKPKHYESVLGRLAKTDIRKGMPLSMEMIS